MSDNIFIQMHKIFIPSKRNEYKPFILRPKNLFILVVVLVAIKFILFSWVSYYSKTSDFAIVTSEKLIEMAEQARADNNLSALKVNDKLTQAAYLKAQDMFKNNYFAHTSPAGINPWYWFTKAGYKYLAAGENLARNFTESEYLHNAWMNSPSHRANILNGKYTEIGIAVVEGEMNGKTTVIAVELFGKPAASAKPAAVPATTTTTTTTNTTTKPANVGVAAQEQQPVQTTVAGEETNPETPIETEVPLAQELIQPSANQVVLNDIAVKSGPVSRTIYFIIAGFISMVLLLTVFVNIRLQYPGVILGAIIFIVIIAAIAGFNVNSFANRYVDIPRSGAMVNFSALNL